MLDILCCSQALSLNTFLIFLMSLSMLFHITLNDYMTLTISLITKLGKKM